MLRNMLFAVAVAAIVVPGAMTTEAMAGSSTDGREQDAHSAAYSISMPPHRRWHVAHRLFRRGFGVGPAPYYGYTVLPRTPVFRGPGYVFVPHVGIVDEACNLPTSACSNEFRPGN
jgi:hypothetical protein